MRFNLVIGVLFLLSLLLPEAWQLVWHIWPRKATEEWNPFFASDVRINALWYLKDIGSSLQMCLWAFMFSMVAKRTSLKLYGIGVLALVYTLIDLFFYLYSYKQNYSGYAVLLTLEIIGIFLLLKPEKQTAKVVSMDDN